MIYFWYLHKTSCWSRY